MKKLLLILSLLALAETKPADASIASFDEWQPDDPHTELIALLITTKKEFKKALENKKDDSQLEKLREYWFNVSNLLTSQDYETTFKETLKTNFEAADLPADTPAYICFGFKRPAQLTPETTKEQFNEIEKLLKEAKEGNTNPQNKLAMKFMELYTQLEQHDIALPKDLQDKEKVIKELHGDKESFLGQADVFMKIIRQAYFCIREPLTLALYKALNESTKKFATVVAEYKTTAKDLGITSDFATQCFSQCIMAKNDMVDEIPALLENEAFKFASEATPTTLQRLTHWFTTLWSTIEETPSSNK